MLKLALKSVAFLVLVAALQTALALLFPACVRIEYPIRDALDEAAGKGLDIVYFGDSVTMVSDPDEEDKHSIAELFQTELPGRSVVTACHAAYNAQIFCTLKQYMDRRGYREKAAVIPVNLRSFSASWDMVPGYQFEKEQVLLRWSGRIPDAALRPMLIFKCFDLEPVKDFDYKVALEKQEAPLEPLLTDLSKKERNFVTPYMYTLERSHRKLRALEDLAELYRGKDSRAVFYLTPIDARSGERLLPREFKRRVDANVAIIKQALKEHGVDVLDLHEALPPEIFLWNREGGATEHLKAEGRRFVARELARAVSGGAAPGP